MPRTQTTTPKTTTLSKTSGALTASPGFLTARKKEILLFILSRPGFPPTVQEIGDAVGLASKSTTHDHIHSLLAAGYLTGGGKTITRTLRLTAKAYAVFGVKQDNPLLRGADGKFWVPVLRTQEDVHAYLRSPHGPAPRVPAAEALTAQKTVLMTLISEGGGR